jgi:hypothetical protein
LAELQAVEESFYMHKQNSEAEGHMSSNITRASKQKCKDFDLNEVTCQIASRNIIYNKNKEKH